MLTPEEEAFVKAVGGREEARRVARATLFEQGDLSWALHAKQREGRRIMAAAYERGVRRGVWKVGRRGGKTRGFVADAFERAIKNPGWRIAYGALTWESATGFVFPEAEWLSTFAPAHIRPAIVDGEVRFAPQGNGATGSRIRVSGTDTKRNADHLRGPSLHWAYLDECAFNPVLDYIVKSVLSPQLLTTGGMLWMGSSPPESPAHPFEAIYAEDAQVRGSLVAYRTRDAPHVTEAQLELLASELGGYDSPEYLRECDLILLTDPKRAVIPEWHEHQAEVVGEAEDPTHRHWYVSADLGYRDLTVVLLGWWDFANARLVVEDERVLIKPRSEEVQAAALEMEQAHQATVESRVADASLITIADMASQQPEGTPEKLRWRLTRKDDKEAAINALRLMVARHQILIHPRCQVTIRHSREAIWNKRRTEYERVSEEGLSHFDALDALVYLARSVDKNRNPFPNAPIPPRAENYRPESVTAPPPRKRGGKVFRRRVRR